MILPSMKVLGQDGASTTGSDSTEIQSSSVSEGESPAPATPTVGAQKPAADSAPADPSKPSSSEDAADNQPQVRKVPAKAQKSKVKTQPRRRGKRRRRRKKIKYVGKTLEEQKEAYEDNFEGNEIELFFDPLKNGVEFPNQTIEYDLTAGNILRFGPVNVRSRNVMVYLSREQVRGKDLGMEDIQPAYVFSFTWPLEYISSGKIEMIDDKNVVKWSREVKNEEVWEWSRRLEDRVPAKLRRRRERSLQEMAFLEGFEKEDKQKVRMRPFKRGHWLSNFAMIGEDFMSIPKKAFRKPFRFCISRRDSDKAHTSVCSRRYKLIRRRGRFRLRAGRKKQLPQVLINDKEQTLEGTAVFLDNQSTIKFSALMTDGTFFEFVSRPKKTNILDMVYNKETKKIEMIGWGVAPVGNVEVIRRESEDFWDFLNFMPTIGDFRNFWRGYIDVRRPYIFLRGEGGAPFKQNFYFDKLPPKTARVRLRADTPDSTYGRLTKLYGVKKNKNVMVKSKEKAAKSLSAESFQWRFLSKEKGDFNRSYIEVKEGEEAWKAYYEMFRGRPREFSFRATGVPTANLELILMAEVASTWWFQDVFGSENKLLSQRRWGITGRYFQSVVSIPSVDIKVANFELKYRLTPGVWGRDPTVGLIGGGQYANNLGLDILMWGGGIFWARSMPKFFDRIFNIIPFMRYPKWVDMEFLWYPVTFEANKNLVFNFAMNFHGKVQWSKSIYGEAGFGIKNFAWQDLNENSAVPITLVYGTVGLGYNF